MRAISFAALAVSALAPLAAQADTASDARGATGACLSAIFDGAPVEDVREGDVSIRRGKNPVSCTVQVSGGQPVVVRDAVMQAITRRADTLVPARSRWDPESFATRETFCNLPSRRSVMTTISTGRPGARVVLVATVVEVKDRDRRCDQDLGVQKLPADATAAATPRPEVAPLPVPPAKPEKKKTWWKPWERGAT